MRPPTETETHLVIIVALLLYMISDTIWKFYFMRALDRMNRSILALDAFGRSPFVPDPTPPLSVVPSTDSFERGGA